MPSGNAYDEKLLVSIRPAPDEKHQSPPFGQLLLPWLDTKRR